MPEKTTRERTVVDGFGAWFSRNAEPAAYVVIAVLALLSHLWMLGARVMSHDESIHVVFSWDLFMGKGYEHAPAYHGPLLYHLGALFYFLFGDSDATARLGPALFGVLLVLFPILLRPWLGRLGALCASVLMLLSPAILYHSRYIRHDIYAALMALALIYVVFRYLHRQEARWVYLAGATFGLLMTTKEVSFIYGAIIGGFLALMWLIDAVRGDGEARQLGAHPAFDMAALLLSLILGFATPLVVKLVFRADPLDYSSAGIMRSGVVFAILVALGGVLGYWRLRNRWLVSAGIFYAIVVVLYTTFFTNYKGIGTGFVGSLGYWLAQQEVQRGGQPWYYYLLLVPEYEFLSLWLAFGGLLAWLRGRPKPEEEGPDPAYTRDDRYLFISFLVWWVAMTWLLYSWAGEKMPWLAVLALPMSLLGGWFVGRLMALLDWDSIREHAGLWLLGAVPLTVYMLVRVVKMQPFASRTVGDLQATVAWLVALGILVFLIWWGYTRWRSLGTSTFTRTVFLAVTAFLMFWTIRVTWYFNYVDYDYATEQMVYAHGAPDVKLVMQQVEDMSRRMYGDLTIIVPYDDDSTWPFEWYLRNYPNKRFYAAAPSSKDTFADTPIAIAGSKNVDKVEALLKVVWRDKGGFEKYRYRLIWWPLESYKGGLREKIREVVTDPDARRRLVNAVLWRRYEYSTSDWPYRHDFYFFVRRDVARQMWDWGVPLGVGAQEGTTVAPEISPYDQAFRIVTALRQIGGGPGTQLGQLQFPRNLALGPDGSIYVADSGNHRIVKFDVNGQAVKSWGGMGTDPGQFNEPWGIAVDAAGNVYVADTWNHRVQKFDADGKFITTWGVAAMTGGALTDPGAFFGPRAIAIDAEGNVYVTDTGNKRVQKFTPDGEFLGQWGGAGVEPGQFDEPVGIAIAPNGEIYVADTWNQRVQVFDKDFNYLREWPIDGWDSESVVNKPYIAVDSQGTVYVTDPENYRVIVFDGAGNVKAVFGQFGTDFTSFGLPNGIAVDAQGQVYVADADNHRVLVFPPVR